MKMKLSSLKIGLSLLLVPALSFGYLPKSAITQMSMPLYGMYTTADPTCLTGLVATIPLKATPTSVNFVSGSAIGRGEIPAGGIKCIIIIAKFEMTFKWAAGTYTGTTSFGTNTYQDSGCNAGGTITISAAGQNAPTCSPAQRSTTMTWPTKVQEDLAALGLTPKTNCNDAGASDLFPLYLSTYSKCYGETALDNAIGGTCAWSNNTNITAEGYRSNLIFQAPTAENDYQRGIHIDALAAGTARFKFIVDPTVAFGGNDGGCNAFGPPKFLFQVKP
jgi:hypothetical protein